MNEIDRTALRTLIGEELAHFADLVPETMARELLHGDHGFIAPYQLSEALLAHLRPEMHDWATPDVLRVLAPDSPLARNRMQAVAGALAPIGCTAYPRFSYFPYLPFAAIAAGERAAPLIIAVHGSSRNAKDLRDAYARFAEERGCFVLAPLFPLDLSDDAPDEAYKQLFGNGVRYDRLLWTMVDEFAALAGVRFTKILLFGFSGGAQFAQRLFHVDPERLAGLSLAAPSYVTLPDRERGWWAGLGDFEARFGKPVDFAAMRAVPVQLLCGSRDVLPCAIYRADEMGMGPADHEGYGHDRSTRLARLRNAWAREGIHTQITWVEGAGHAFGPLLEASKPFFRTILDDSPETGR